MLAMNFYREFHILWSRNNGEYFMNISTQRLFASEINFINAMSYHQLNAVGLIFKSSAQYWVRNSRHHTGFLTRIEILTSFIFHVWVCWGFSSLLIPRLSDPLMEAPAFVLDSENGWTETLLRNQLTYQRRLHQACQSIYLIFLLSTNPHIGNESESCFNWNNKWH